MHMPDVLVAEPVVFGSTLALGGAAVAVAAARAKRTLDDSRVPLLGVLGAFVFAGQMVNFPLPGLFTSGHLGGAALLTAIVGPWAAILVMAAVLGIQSLLFQDGGLLALGANLLLMGIVPALVTQGCLSCTRRWLGGARGVLLGAGVGAWLALLVSASIVPLLAAASGALPEGVGVRAFLGVMIGFHALIGVGEALITLGVLGFLVRVRPDLIPHVDAPRREGRGQRLRLLAAGLVVSLAIGGGLSQLASGHADGLEKSMEVVGVGEEASGAAADVLGQVASFQSSVALFADYETFPGVAHPQVALSLGGVAGTLIVFGLLWLVSLRATRPRVGARPLGTA